MLDIIFNAIGSIDWQFIVCLLVAVATEIIDFYTAHKSEIDAVVLRVEKDSQDGWTNEKKEQVAVDLYKQFKPKFPARIRMLLAIIPDSWEEGYVRKLIRSMCKKASNFKKEG